MPKVQPGKTKRKRKRKPKDIDGPPVQLHHEFYEPDGGEIVGKTVGHLFKGEHATITSLHRQTRNVSTWFILCLKRWLRQAEKLNATKVRPFRDLNWEVTDLPEGRSYHCPHCKMGFLVKKNREKHKGICAKRGSS